MRKYIMQGVCGSDSPTFWEIEFKSPLYMEAFKCVLDKESNGNTDAERIIIEALYQNIEHAKDNYTVGLINMKLKYFYNGEE